MVGILICAQKSYGQININGGATIIVSDSSDAKLVVISSQELDNRVLKVEPEKFKKVYQNHQIVTSSKEVKVTYRKGIDKKAIKTPISRNSFLLSNIDFKTAITTNSQNSNDCIVNNYRIFVHSFNSNTIIDYQYFETIYHLRKYGQLQVRPPPICYT